jgi:magnesium transporter
MAIRQSIPDVRASPRRRDLVGLRESLKNWPPPDLAELLDEASVEDEVVLFRILPRKLAAETFAYLTPRQQERLLKAMAKEEVTTILNTFRMTTARCCWRRYPPAPPNSYWRS